MSVKTTVEKVKAAWNGLTPKKKIAVCVGGALLLAIGAANQNEGAQNHQAFNGRYGPYAPGDPNAPYGPNGPSGPGGPYASGPMQGQAYQGGPYQSGPQGAPYQGAYQGGGAPQGQVAASGGDGADMNGYWARQRSQDQQHQAFTGYINDTTTVRDAGDGTVYSNVDNAAADPLIASGAATAVATSDLPTSYDSSASAPSE
ncbi:hypothetical protein [Phenylobacterium sp.]|uniref:hypothetical protein n=1 Tax=Phenylobacterium sp. TaxID=1871053 RepID=UPI002733C059|nr:hypothetical protein [Phenylobacterium sp.]MDP3660972.1 hypothetical protein [Phenylobacterium sp.]